MSGAFGLAKAERICSRKLIETLFRKVVIGISVEACLYANRA